VFPERLKVDQFSPVRFRAVFMPRVNFRRHFFACPVAPNARGAEAPLRETGPSKVKSRCSSAYFEGFESWHLSGAALCILTPSGQSTDTPSVRGAIGNIRFHKR